MTFNSLQFLIFFPIVVALYFLLPKKITKYMLLVASYYFYLAWNYKLIGLILFTTVVSYVSARIIEKNESKKVKKTCIVVTLVACLGVLFFFKYYNFMADSASFLWGLVSGIQNDWTLNLVLPVGISFYTFQTLSYAIDVYRGQEKAEHDFFLYALYVSFFPQLVAGPIERPGNLIPQLREKHKFNPSDVKIGLWMMASGFFKKIAVADFLAMFVNSVFNAAEDATGFGVLIASIFFTIQIYCDFSGYTDIAIGCARIMGIKLMKNFDMPFLSKSIKEFWGRWHISLSSWLRDYLYFPLGGSRCSKPRHLLNILIVFLASGLWHGAAWTFVIWGALHGIYRIIEELLRNPSSKLRQKLGIKENSKVLGAAKTAGTFLLVCFAFIFFRANSFDDLAKLLSLLFTSWGSIPETLENMGLTASAIIYFVVAIALITAIDFTTKRGEESLEENGSAKIAASVCLWAVIIAWMLLNSVGGASTFIYFQF